jgi:O-acetyl-ADP-ribose deacetylase (regulator of RNase III)
MIEIARGNLLDAPVDALVNSVNTVGVMGKGIALQFKRAFPDNFAAYEAACKRGDVAIGRVFGFRTGKLQPRWILNVPTKRSWRQPSKLDDVRKGVKALVEEVARLGVTSVAVPPLGCGAGGLAWSEVRPLLEGAFAALPDVEVLLFEPGAAPVASEMPNRTSRPAMTPGRAAMLALAGAYLDSGLDETVTTLELQKLAYFMQEAGEPLKLKFVDYIYGPYADALRKVLEVMEGHYISGLGDDGANPRTEVRLLPGAREEAEAFLASKPVTRGNIARVIDLIQGFEDAYGLELLATTHRVMVRDGTADEDAVVRGVHEWNARKKRELSASHVRAAWARLRELGW